MLLKEMDILGEIKFVHPKDVQDGKIEVNEFDILTNLPYVAGCHLCFDHHTSEGERAGGEKRRNHVLEPEADSAARVVYNYYGGKKRFPAIKDEMMLAVDKADAARFSLDDVLNPQGWELLSFLMDARTGLGRFRNFRVSNYQLMMALVDYCRDHTIENILALPDVVERVELYREHNEAFVQQVNRCAKTYGNLVSLDLRNEETIYAGNRFVIYAMHPECTVSMHVLWGLKQQNTVFTIGKSIFNRSSRLDIGSLCLEYGGGGHENAGTCQVANEVSEIAEQELIERITEFDVATLVC
ncbi:MAG: exopolyphosphatase [Planctomycetota bacterium]|nr:exopolyphosphatase [Planctomycetota bacterium]